MIKRVKGTVNKSSLEGGHWCIETSSKTYMILNMPDQLKYDHKKVKVYLKEMPEVITFSMTGVPALIVGFSS